MAGSRVLTRQFPATSHVWWDAYVYFPVGMVLPTASGRSPHLWRLYSNFGGLDGIPGSGRVAMDFNIPAALAGAQLALFVCGTQSNCPNQEYAKWLAYKPADPSMQGLWQHWQIDIDLGTPGNSDGYFRFYSDSGAGTTPMLIGSMENKPFLPAGSDSSYWFRYADFQSNIGGSTGVWSTSPTMGWYIDDIRLCSGGPC